MNHETVQPMLDWLSIGLVTAFFANILPPIALVLTIAWTLIRIAEWVRHRFIVKDPSQFK